MAIHTNLFLVLSLVVAVSAEAAQQSSSIFPRSRESSTGLKVRNLPLSYRSMGSGLHTVQEVERKKPNAVLMVAHGKIAASAERLIVQLTAHLARPYEIIVFTQPSFRKMMTEKWGEKLLVTYVDSLPNELDQQSVDRMDTRRFKIWRDYLKVRARSFANVMVTDSSTVLCQGDPFAFVPEGKIVFSKELRKTLGGHIESRTLLKKIDAVTSSKLLPAIGGHQIISSRVILGDSQVVAGYLNRMVSLLKSSAKKEVTLLDLPAIDQVFHNVLLYSEDHMRDDPKHVLHGAFDSPVFSMGTATDSDYAMDLTGIVYHKKGKPAMVQNFQLHPRLNRMARLYESLFIAKNVFDGTSGFRSNFAERNQDEKICF